MLFNTHSRRFIWRALNVLVAVALFIPSGGVQAGLFSLRTPGVPSIPMPTASSFASDTERRYHVNSESLQEQGETLNVSDSKKVTPEVSIFFSPSDPEEGQKLTGRAFPIYFSGKSNEMYYTWYLQRNGCEEDTTPSQAQITNCDRNGNGRVDPDDWKIEAARIQASNNFEFGYANYAVADTDNDGYQARYGGDSRVSIPNYCYYHENTSGENYEIVENVEQPEFNCNAGLQPVCMEGTANVGPGDLSLEASGGTGSGGGSGTGSSGTGTGEGSGTGTGGSATASGAFFETGDGNDAVTGSPYCSSTGIVGCITGVPCCVANPATATTCTQNITDGRCSVATAGDSNPICRHLFPNAAGFTTGDGAFSNREEQFWRTDPADPDTADNGNKDEANVTGLGLDSFSWNYTRGDKLGVVVEGVSMIPTKHSDASSMIMWAFSKNRCPIAGATGSYQKRVRGYDVVIPTIGLDLNGCLKHNLVDPLEGGQATRLEVNLAATPQDPLNDSATQTNNGDTVTVSSSINNTTQDTEQIYFDWKVYLSRDGTIAPNAGWENITQALVSMGTIDETRRLLSTIKGNGVKTLNLRLNLKPGDVFGGRNFDSFTPGGIGYLRFQVDVAENFNAGGANRRGRSDVIVKFTSTADRIAAYRVNVNGDPAKLSLSDTEICSGLVAPTDPPERQVLTRLDAKLCRVIKNEIIGLKVLASGGLSNYNWTINGLPLICNSQVSGNCVNNEQQGDMNFFPIIGNTGDVFTITVSTNKVDTATSGQKAVTLSRAFKIVEPEVSIVSGDETTAWPKLLGRYTDTNGGTYNDYSKTTLQAFSGATVNLRALFTPDFLGNNLSPQVERGWTVDGQAVGDGDSNAIAFDATKPPESIYNISLSTVYRPSALTRKAMQDIWQISNLDSTEVFFSTETQLEHPPAEVVAQGKANKYLALLSSYLPAPLLFSIRIFLSAGLIIFVTGFLFALIPNAPNRMVYSRRRE